MPIIVRVLFACAALLAWYLARVVPRYRAVAVVLTLGLCCDMERAWLALYLGGPTPFQGAHRALYHLDQLLLFAFPVMSAALASYILGQAWQRRPGGIYWPYSVALLPFAVGCWLGLLVAYPHTRGVPVERIYTVLWAASVASQMVEAARALLRGETLGPPDRACLVLLAGDAAALLGPFWGAPIAHWSIWRLQAAITLGTLTVLEARWISARKLVAGGSAAASSQD